MIDTTYDAEADAVYFRIGRGQIIEIAEAGPFIYDVDAQGRGIGKRRGCRDQEVLTRRSKPGSSAWIASSRRQRQLTRCADPRDSTGSP
jgi:hypothetical protein